MNTKKPFRPAPCPDCGQKPHLWEVSFYGYSMPKFKVECPKCGKRTGFYSKSVTAANAWNRGSYLDARPGRDFFDREGLLDLMGKVMDAVNDDYQRIAVRDPLTRWEKAHLEELECFIVDNPYALPYHEDYMVEQMRKQAEAAKAKKPRKKQIS